MIEIEGVKEGSIFKIFVDLCIMGTVTVVVKVRSTTVVILKKLPLKYFVTEPVHLSVSSLFRLSKVCIP